MIALLWRWARYIRVRLGATYCCKLWGRSRSQRFEGDNVQGFTRPSLHLLIGVIIGLMWSYATLGPYKVIYIYYGVGNVVSVRWI